MTTAALDALQAKLGHRFANEKLLTRALTHASADGGRSNERLEFLGDRVLGLVIAGELLRRFPESVEGELATRLNALVRGETCSRVAQATGLEGHLILAPGERQSGRLLKTSILGDACEAVIAALYLDGGLEPAQRFILAAWATEFADVATLERDPKNLLQEWAQSRAELGRALPEYRTVSQTGPAHAPLFVIEVTVGGAGAAQGEGASKRLAEREAAEALLARLKVQR